MPRIYKRYDQSDLRPIKSLYKDGFVTVDNYIAELIFQRRAVYNKTTLPHQFWNSPKYKQQYVIQIIHINKLLERISSSAIIRAFKDSKAISVLNKKLVELAEQYQAELDNQVKIVEKTELPTDKPSKPFGKTNPLTEL